MNLQSFRGLPVVAADVVGELAAWARLAARRPWTGLGSLGLALG
jgi:hypothetical protein